jgi:hypothetical protein
VSADPLSLGPYVALETLGRGGMGVVYRGTHRETGEAVAIKTVLGASEPLLQSIRREVRALASVRHPRVVRIVDEGVEGGLPWYAMELVEGRPLGRYWRDAVGSLADTYADLSERPPAAFGRLPVALALVRRLCEPLGYLPGEGLVHRDVKPANVIVKPGGWPVLVDFGLLAHFSSEVSREVLEIGDLAAGTPSYMAPEQIRGELVDARADLYSVGCILYELVTGRPPFVGGSSRDVLRRHLHEAPAPMSRLAAGVPEELDELALRLLSKDPRDRIGYASDAAAALERLGAGDAAAAELPRHRAYLYRPGFGGRRREMQALGGRLDTLVDGRGGLALVGGESGIGKTRLMLEVAREAASMRVRVLAGEAESRAEGASAGALGLLGAPLRQIADRCLELGRAESDRVVGRWGKLLGAYEPAVATLPGQDRYPDPPELPPDAARSRLFAGLAEVLAAFAAGNTPDASPLLVALDDLQWADELSLGFLEYVARGDPFAGARVLVFGTYRAEEVGGTLGPLLEAYRERGGEPIHLDRFGNAQVASMVSDMLALPSPPEAFTAFVARQTEGNPLFVAEYLRLAVEEGALSRDDAGRWRVDGPGEGAAAFETLGLPTSVRQLVGRRLDGLSEAALRCLDAAAVLGREDAEHIFAGDDLIPAAIPFLRFVAHGSRHSLNFSRLRRNQVRIVLSGIL